LTEDIVSVVGFATTKPTIKSPAVVVIVADVVVPENAAPSAVFDLETKEAGVDAGVPGPGHGIPTCANAIDALSIMKAAATKISLFIVLHASLV